jgi:penicillin-insensitive murein endopeptidase
VSRTFRLGTGAIAILLLLACQARSTGGANVESPADHGGGALDFGSRAAPTVDEDASLALEAPEGDPAAASVYGPDNVELDEGDPESGDTAHDPVASSYDGRFHGTRGSAPSPHPLAALSEAELKRKLEEDPRALGSASLGRPNAGALFNGVPMPEDTAWTLVDPRHAFGTQETVDSLSLALRAVYERFPGTAPVPIGHLSARDGGHLRPHRSHQSGRDVDLGFYFRDGAKSWYARATPDTLDLERTVFFLCTLLERTEIEMVLVDQSLHEPLRTYAESHGVDETQIDALFRPHGGVPPIVRHAPGHATHLHLRFRSPVAQHSGVRLASLLTAKRLVTVPPKTVVHVARSGDTLAKLAERYHTTMRAIRVRNQMPGTALVAGRTYQIPVTLTARETSTKSTASARTKGPSKK